MSPIRRKTKRSAGSAKSVPIQAEPIGVEPLDAEYIDAEPKITGKGKVDFVSIVFVIVLLGASVAVLSWLGLPGEYAALVFTIIVLFVGTYCLRRPGTEKEPNPTFDPRLAWPGREGRSPINSALARPTIESTPFLLAAGIRKARRAHSKSEGRISGEGLVDIVSIVFVIVLVGAIVTFLSKPSAVAAFLSKLGLPGELAVIFIYTVLIILLVVFRVALSLSRLDTEKEPNPTLDQRIGSPWRKRLSKRAAEPTQAELIQEEPIQAEPIRTEPIEVEPLRARLPIWLLALAVARASAWPVRDVISLPNLTRHSVRCRRVQEARW